MRKTILAAALLFLLSACGGVRAYNGPTLPSNELATFKGYSTGCYGRLEIVNFDGEFSGIRLKAPAGPHHMVIRATSEPFNPIDNGRQNPMMVCVWRSEFDVEFPSRAQYIYFFHPQDFTNTGTSLTVWESDKPGGVNSHQIEATVTRTLLKQLCAPTMQYNECLGIGR